MISFNYPVFLVARTTYILNSILVICTNLIKNQLACGVGAWFLNMAFVLDMLYDGNGDGDVLCY